MKLPACCQATINAYERSPLAKPAKERAVGNSCVGLICKKCEHRVEYRDGKWHRFGGDR